MFEKCSEPHMHYLHLGSVTFQVPFVNSKENIAQNITKSFSYESKIAGMCTKLMSRNLEYSTSSSYCNKATCCLTAHNLWAASLKKRWGGKIHWTCSWADVQSYLQFEGALGPPIWEKFLFAGNQTGFVHGFLYQTLSMIGLPNHSKHYCKCELR